MKSHTFITEFRGLEKLLNYSSKKLYDKMKSNEQIVISLLLVK